jgi:integrase
MARATRRGKSSRRKPAQKAPVIVSEDSVAVTIRFSPMKIGGLWYESWIVDYWLHGARHRDRKNSFRKARTWAVTIANKMANGEVEALELTGEDRRIYLASLENIKGLGIPLDAATREYADAKRLVKKADLRDVSRFHNRYAQKGIRAIKVPALVKKLIDDLEADGRSDYHIRDMEIRLSRFAEAFPGEIGDVKGPLIDAYLRGLKSRARNKKGQAIAGKTRNNHRNGIVELFNYAKKNAYLPKDLGTEAQSTTRVKEVKKDNEIFAASQMNDLLHTAPIHLVPSMATKAFSGVRTEEVARMGFEDASTKKGHVILPRKITKSMRRRIQRMRPNLRKWLEPFEGLVGRMCWRYSTSQSVFQAWEKAARKLGIKAGANRFRNSFISFRVAQTNDIKLTAKESGNSERDIEDNYLELATEEEAAEWFSIEPSPERLKELQEFTAELKKNWDN